MQEIKSPRRLIRGKEVWKRLGISESTVPKVPVGSCAERTGAAS
jgi:hypothetical protein